MKAERYSALHDCDEEYSHSRNRTDQDGKTIKESLHDHIGESADLECLYVTESREVYPKHTDDETDREEDESDRPALAGSEVRCEDTCEYHHECECENNNRKECHELHSFQLPCRYCISTTERAIRVQRFIT